MVEKRRAKGINSVLREQTSLIKPDKKTMKYLKSITKEFTETLEEEIRKTKFAADVLVGGSFAKGTLVKKDKYDIDIFVRFDWKYDNISALLEDVLKKVSKKAKVRLEKIHGSRDYFRVYIKGKDIYFEVIPVTKIKKPQEEKNVTDLTPFHVPYIKKRIKGREDDLILAKTFCHAQKVYGAESYIQGFSGYALECLIIYYKNLEKMLRELSKVKTGERLVIDPANHYKKKNDVFFELNENKLHSPVILIDPTYKERNALASLGHDTFKRFQESARAFLRRPSKSFFIEKEIDPEKIKKRAKKNKAEFLHIKLKTNKQPGDIAGTKLKKFHYLLEDEIKKYFKLVHHEFDYNDKQGADVYMIAKSKKEIVRIGPPLKMRSKKEMMAMKKHIQAFKREHRNTYEKNGYVHAKIKVNFTAKKFLENWKKEYKKTMSEMGIVGMRVLE